MLTAATMRGFSGSLLQKNFDGAVESPECHMEWWELCCSKDPRVAIAAPRRHAKSTAITFAYTLAMVVFRESRYCILVSDTVAQSIQFLGDLKKELGDNDELRRMFKIKELIKDTEDDIIVICDDGHTFRIQAKGSEQKVRGLKWNNLRPDLLVCDDMENDEIVMNKDRREKFRRWFYGALVPCISIKGKIRYVGTILHNDSMLESLMPKEWHKGTVVTPLKVYNTRKQPWTSIKYRAHSDDFLHILWPQNYDKQYFVELRQDYINQGIPDVYSQEYLNRPIDETLSYFKRRDFIGLEKEDKAKALRYYITGDLAISQAETADYTVFVVAGVDEDKHIHIKNVIRERLDGREIVDTILALEKQYQPEAIGIEEMQVSKAIGPFLREEMIRSNVFPTLVKLKHQGKDKISRARSMQARLRAQSVKFEKGQDWYQTFEDECVTFPRGKHDDQVDAFAYLGMLLDIIIEAPTKQEAEEEIYLDELRASGLSDAGRSSVTGY
jgi:predicted phage terminase large subunit-like protein